MTASSGLSLCNDPLSNSVDPSAQASTPSLIIFSSIFFLIGLGLALSARCAIKRYQKNPTGREIERLLNKDRRTFTHTMSQINNDYFDDDTRARLSEMFLPWRVIELRTKVLGEGAFGVAMLGHNRLLDRPVCLKIFRAEEGSMLESEIERLSNDLFHEILRMKDLEHENVMKSVGFSLDDNNRPVIILPFMENGDLLTLLRDGARAINYHQAVKFCLEAAQGMDYLSRKDIIHRDLAARNCLIDERMTLKIADFGLAKHIESAYEKSEAYQTKTHFKLPIRWMAIEALKDRLFSIKSDVWSFGILVWEIMTRGERPYLQLSTLNGKLELKCCVMLNGDILYL